MDICAQDVPEDADRETLVVDGVTLERLADAINYRLCYRLFGTYSDAPGSANRTIAREFAGLLFDELRKDRKELK